MGACACDGLLFLRHEDVFNMDKSWCRGDCRATLPHVEFWNDWLSPWPIDGSDWSDCRSGVLCLCRRLRVGRRTRKVACVVQGIVVM